MIRKYVTIIICIILCATITANAQYFKGGLLFGLTGSQMDGDQMTGYNKLGITTGFFIRNDFSNKIAVQTDFKYIMKGAATFITNNSNGGYSQTLHYAEIPAFICFRISKKLECETGLAAAMLLYDTKNITGEDVITGNGIKPYDFSSIFGFTYLYTEKLNVNLKLSYSLKAISYNWPTNQTLLGLTGQFNNVLELAVYYKLR